MKAWTMKAWLLALILLASVATAAWANVTTPGTNSGQTISILTVASGVTTNTTTDTVSGVLGNKTYWGQVIGTGAVTQTQAIYGDVDNDGANGILLCTITLSGTTRAQDACPVVTAAFAYYYVITTNTTGTGATGAVYAMY